MLVVLPKQKTIHELCIYNRNHNPSHVDRDLPGIFLGLFFFKKPKSKGATHYHRKTKPYKENNVYNYINFNLLLLFMQNLFYGIINLKQKF